MRGESGCNKYTKKYEKNALMNYQPSNWGTARASGRPFLIQGVFIEAVGLALHLRVEAGLRLGVSGRGDCFCTCTIRRYQDDTKPERLKGFYD